MFFAIFVILFFTSLSFGAEAEDYSSTIKIFKENPTVAPFFKKSYGYAVFPIVGKGGLGIGGAYGKGQVYVQGKPVGIAKLMKLSVGFQAGGQAYSEIIFFQDKRAFEEFTSGSFEFDAEASAVAITAGAHAEVGTGGKGAGASAGPKTGVNAEVKFTKGMAVFVHIKGGLMYEATIGGQKFSYKPL
jgi:lipid-binding SYLF domain-containing protein